LLQLIEKREANSDGGAEFLDGVAEQRKCDGCCDTFIDGAGLVLGLRLLQLGRRKGFGHALASTIIAVEIAELDVIDVIGSAVPLVGLLGHVTLFQLFSADRSHE
jgi:hypothetical protein